MIRRYRSTDLDAVLRVWEEASRLAHPFLGEDFLAAEREQIRSVHLVTAETWVSEQDGAILGFLALLGSEVGAIFVRPDLQRLGTGRALMAHAQTLRGDLEVEVFEKNAIGRAFYARCGFQFIAHKVHESSGEGLIRLRLAANKSLHPTPPAAGELHR